jgi:hypothetical protein
MLDFCAIGKQVVGIVDECIANPTRRGVTHVSTATAALRERYALLMSELDVWYSAADAVIDGVQIAVVRIGDFVVAAHRGESLDSLKARAREIDDYLRTKNLWSRAEQLGKDLVGLRVELVELSKSRKSTATYVRMMGVWGWVKVAVGILGGIACVVGTVLSHGIAAPITLPGVFLCQRLIVSGTKEAREEREACAKEIRDCEHVIERMRAGVSDHHDMLVTMTKLRDEFDALRVLLKETVQRETFSKGELGTLMGACKRVSSMCAESRGELNDARIRASEERRWATS